ncbi:uncharacterized protein LOC110446217 isoform X1 [Mizuhopecten yessoensis]|nr:uncharacterized protein LOC110446217 isoform X1 [Mizuhopecten yessoensis]XP_021346930.1 uncharacterized protein LOC110446217 isoform X1 [Mizuhopecten yessoensis]
MDAESGGSAPMDVGGDHALADLHGLDFEFVTSTENENIWCDQCKVLKQELQKLQQEHSLNYSTLKKKVISTDLLIKKYKAKCEDHDAQSKTVEDTSKKLEQVQRESSTLNVQLTSSLQQIEPLKKAKNALELELRQKVKEIQTLQDKLTASVAVTKQYESLAKSSTSEKDKTEEERKTNSKRLKELQASLNKQEQLMSKLKDENKTLKAEHLETVKKQRKLQHRLKVSVERFDKYWAILKEHDLLPKGEKRLRTASYLDSDESDLEELEENEVSHGFVGCHNMLKETGPGEEDKDSDEESLLWTFSPIVHALSPLPPSPAPPRQCDSPVDGLSQSDEDDQLAKQLEAELLQPNRKKFQKHIKNQVKGRTDSSIMKKSVEGRLLRRQSATVRDSESHLSDEEKLDETLVPESKKLQVLKDDSTCSLSKEEDLVRTSDTAIHTSPEEEQSEEIISPGRRRVSSRIDSNSDSDTDVNSTKKDSDRKKSQDLQEKSPINRTSTQVKEQVNFSKKNAARYSLRRSPRCEDVIPLGKRLTRSMSSPLKVSPKGSNSIRRHSPRLSLSSEMDCSKQEEGSTKDQSGVSVTLSSHKGNIKTKLDLEKLRRDYKAMQCSQIIKNTAEDDVNSQLYRRSKSKTILPTSGAKGRKNVATADNVCVDIKPPSSTSVIESCKQGENKEGIVLNNEVEKEENKKNSEAGRTERQSDVLKGTRGQNCVTEGTAKQSDELEGTKGQNHDVLEGTKGQNHDTDKTARQSDVLEGTKGQNHDTDKTARQSDVLEGTKGQNHGTEVTAKQSYVLEGTKGQNHDTEVTAKQSESSKGPSDKLEGQSDCTEKVSDNLRKSDETDKKKERSDLTEVKSDIKINGETESSQSKTLVDGNGSLLGVPGVNDVEGDAGIDETQRGIMSRQSSTGFILKPSFSIDSMTDQNLTPPQTPSPRSKSSGSLAFGEVTLEMHSSESALSSISKLSEGAAIDELRCNTETIGNECKSEMETIDQTKQVNKISKTKSVEKYSENTGEDYSLVKNSFLHKGDSVESCGDNMTAENYLSKPSTSTDTELSLPVYIPFSSQPHSSQNPPPSVTSSTVISPEMSSLSEDGSIMSEPIQISHSSSSSLVTASPVSPLPPSPIDFIIPFALSPLPPSPMHEQDPLSPLPGSPWEGDTEYTPLVRFSIREPSSENSSENTPVVTPVPNFLAAKSESPTPGTSAPAGEKAGDALCSFHAEAPAGAIYVKPKVVSNKRSSDLDDALHSKPKVTRTDVKQVTVKPRGEKTAAKRKSTSKLPCLVSAEKKLCTDIKADGHQPETQISQGSKRSQKSPEISAILLNVVQMVMEQYVDSPEVSTSKAVESLLATDKDEVVVLSAWIHWLVQHLLHSTVDSLTLLKPVYDSDQKPTSYKCPFLAEQEARLLQFYSELQQRRLLDDLKQKLLDSIWCSLSLSNLLPVTGASALSRMYTGVCRLDGDVECVRVMVFKLLVSTSLPFHSLGVAIAGVWPVVLYKANKDPHSVVTVIEQRITRTLNTGKQDDEKILECYHRLCNWCRVTSDSQILSKQLLLAMSAETRATKPCQDKIFSLMRSLELLFVMEPMEFFLIHGGLNYVCQKCTKPRKVKVGDCREQNFDPEYSKCVFRLLGCVLPKKRDARIKNINQAVKNLQKVLKSDVCVDVKHCVVETLLELCVLTPNLTLNVLRDWYDTYKSHVPRSLRQKIIWTRETMLKKYPVLKCPPFR